MSGFGLSVEISSKTYSLFSIYNHVCTSILHVSFSFSSHIFLEIHFIKIYHITFNLYISITLSIELYQILIQ